MAMVLLTTVFFAPFNGYSWSDMLLCRGEARNRVGGERVANQRRGTERLERLCGTYTEKKQPRVMWGCLLGDGDGGVVAAGASTELLLLYCCGGLSEWRKLGRGQGCDASASDE